MSKYIFDKAKETLLSVGATFIAVPCNPIGEENSDMIHLRNTTQEYESEISKVVKALDLGEAYKELAEFWKKKASLTYVPIDDEELERLENRIKELEK